MRPRVRTFARLLAVPAFALALAACQIMPTRPAAPAPAAVSHPSNDRDMAAAMFMADTFRTMQRLAQSAPAEQAEILSSAREAFERTPRGNAQLRYALLLATPGHPARNALMARILLRELIAQPDALVPIERAVVMVELAQLGHELDLQTDNEHLQAAALRADQQRSAASERQIDAEAVENIRLRKELEAAKAKLDAIASIERNLTDRRTGTEADAATTRPTRRRPARPSAAPGTGSAPASGTSPAAAGSTSPATPGSATAPARAPASTESAPATRASNVPGTTSGPVTGSKDPSK